MFPWATYMLCSQDLKQTKFSTSAAGFNVVNITEDGQTENWEEIEKVLAVFQKKVDPVKKSIWNEKCGEFQMLASAKDLVLAEDLFLLIPGTI